MLIIARPIARPIASGPSSLGLVVAAGLAGASLPIGRKSKGYFVRSSDSRALNPPAKMAIFGSISCFPSALRAHRSKPSPCLKLLTEVLMLPKCIPPAKADADFINYPRAAVVSRDEHLV